MKLNKEEVIERINNLPEFELTDVFLPNTNKVKGFRAVKNNKSDEVVAFVTPKYELVQFKSVFLPAIKNIDDFKGVVWYWKGKAVLGVYPTGDGYDLEDGGRIGIIVRNSVDKSNSVTANFAILYKGLHMGLIPMEGLKKVHVGEPLQMTEDFLNAVNKAKETWRTIATKFSSFEVTPEIAIDLIDKVKGGKRTKKEVLSMLGNSFNLWDLFLYLIMSTHSKNYRSEVHRAEKIEKIAEELHRYAVVANI